MAKKVVKKRKLKLIPLLITLLFLGGLSFGVYIMMQTTTKNIIVSNTKYLNDDVVLALAGLKEYPSYYLTSTKKIERLLEKSPYITKAKIKREFYHTFDIHITENLPLFIHQTTKSLVFSDQQEVPVSEEIELFRIPRLINYVPDDKYTDFILGMKDIKKDILGKISDIEYQPNDFDKDRFLLYMDDGNMVYLTLTKFEMINYYNDMLSQLEDKRGILYLDNGNHFQIRE